MYKKGEFKTIYSKLISYKFKTKLSQIYTFQSISYCTISYYVPTPVSQYT